MTVPLIEPTLERYRSGPKGPEGMERERRRGLTAQTKRRDTGVLEMRAGLYRIVLP
jgi:hypothetical protein